MEESGYCFIICGLLRSKCPIVQYCVMISGWLSGNKYIPYTVEEYVLNEKEICW
jgi:hypothetical protein